MFRRKKFVDYYKVLQVDTEADSDVIEAAFRKLARKYHPDTNPSGGAEERMKLINEAYSVLSDRQERARYDDFHRRIKEGNVEPHAGYGKSPAKDYLVGILIKAALVGLIVLAMRVNVRLGAILGVIIVVVWLLRGLGGRK